MERISREHLSLAGEYAVASELCRMGIYAQLTLGTRKKVDLLVDNEIATLRIQVKTKQIKHWFCKGIYGQDIMLVFVDYKNKAPDQRPDFYILTPDDWENFVKSGWVHDWVSEGRMRLDIENRPYYVSKQGRESPPGAQVEPANISEHKEQWDKIKALLKVKG